MALPHFRCKGQAACVTSQGSTCALSSSNPARPYVWRLMAFSRLICPSLEPLLHGGRYREFHSFQVAPQRVGKLSPGTGNEKSSRNDRPLAKLCLTKSPPPER
jgi:hypothetical protein